MDDEALLQIEDGSIQRDIGKWKRFGSFHMKTERWAVEKQCRSTSTINYGA